MPFNLSSSGNASRVSLGTGTLKLDPWVDDATVTAGGGATPAVADVGYGRGGSLTITRQRAELLLGTPRRLIAQYAIQEDVTLAFEGVEWNTGQLYNTLGAGVTGGSATDQNMAFGGSLSFANLKSRFIHQMPAGGTVTFDLFKCQGSGEATVNFTDDFHAFPFNLRALQATDGLTFQATEGDELIAENGGLFRVRIEIS